MRKNLVYGQITVMISKFSPQIFETYFKYTLFFHKRLIYKKLILGWPNCLETFSTQATKVKKLLDFFFHFQYHNFEDKVTNFDKVMFRKESFHGTNSHS